jgi:hypothetical protein
MFHCQGCGQVVQDGEAFRELVSVDYVYHLRAVLGLNGFRTEKCGPCHPFRDNTDFLPDHICTFNMPDPHHCEICGEESRHPEQITEWYSHLFEEDRARLETGSD